MFLPYSTPTNSGCLINNVQRVLSPSAAKYHFSKNPDLNVNLIPTSVRTALISSGSLVSVWQRHYLANQSNIVRIWLCR